MSEEYLEPEVQALLDAGLAFKNADGTFRLNDELHLIAQTMINERPHLYAQIFPDRMH